MPARHFVGRSTDLTRLQRLADEVATTGIGRFVLVIGEAGAGKTQLCAEFVRRMPEDSMVTAWSQCWDGGGAPPLWPWPDLVGELERQGDAVLALIPSGTLPDRFGLFQTILRQLRELTVGRAAVALLDDLQAAGNEAVQLTRFIVRALHRCPLLVVATWRVDPAPTTKSLADLDALSREAVVVELMPFNEGEIASYVRLFRQREASVAEVAELLAASGGNPMYLAELVDQPALSEGVRGGGLPNVLRRRIQDLTAQHRRVLGIAAVLGPGARVDEVATILDCPAADVIEVATERRAGARIVRDEIVFTHDLLRDAFAAALSPAQRQEIHAAAASVIQGMSAEQAVRRAGHAVEAAGLSAEHRRVAIAACATSAEHLVRSLAFEQAAEWAAKGASLAAGTSAGTEAELLLAQATAVLACGRLTEARELYDRAVEPAVRSGEPQLLARAALGLGGVWVEERRDELSRRRMLALCRQASAALGSREPVLGALLAVRLAAEQAYDGVPDADVASAVQSVRQLGHPAATAEALSLYHHTLLAPEHASMRLDVAGEMLDAAARAHGTIYSVFALCWRTVDLYLLGDPRAERSFAELRERSTALGSKSIGYITAVLEVMRTYRRGDLARAEALAAEALQLGQAVGDADAFGYYGAHLLGIRWAQGRLEELHDMVSAVLQSGTLRRGDRIYLALSAYTSTLRGDHPAARMHLDAVLADGFGALLQFSTGAATVAVMVETAAELGDGDLAVALAELLSPYAHLPVLPSMAVMCLGPGQRTVALAHATAGRLDEAVTWYRAALDANRSLQNRPFEAIIRAGLATVLLRRGSSGDVDEASRLLLAAISIGTDIGLDGRVAQWEAELAAVDGGRPAIVPLRGRLERLAGGWRLEIDGRSTTVHDIVGLRHVAELVARPDVDIAAATLSAAVTGDAAFDATSRGVPALDRHAVADYQRRLGELDHELDLADVLGDAARARRLADERRFLIDTLRRDIGLGGRPRRLSDDTERSRMRVSKAIHRAIKHVGDADAVLGHALRTRIRTGHVCRYVTDPGQPIVWTVRTSASPRSS